MVRPFNAMDITNDPIETIENWQRWYRENQQNISLNKPTETPMTEAQAKEMWIQKAQEHFADTLAEYQYELTGKDFYKAFYQAAYENMEATRKEYENAKNLIDMLRYLPSNQN